MVQTLLWSRMTCSSKIFKYPSAVLAETPTTYILVYCNACIFSAFTVIHCFQFKKKVLELNATLGQSSDRTVQHLYSRTIWQLNFERLSTYGLLLQRFFWNFSGIFIVSIKTDTRNFSKKYQQKFSLDAIFFDYCRIISVILCNFSLPSH